MIELAKISREEFKQQAAEHNQRLLEEFQQAKAVGGDLHDEDGYPTEYALNLLEIWHWSDAKGWFEFVKELWTYKSFGWAETEGGIDDWTNEQLPETTKRFHISTAGWSGNESVIRAMQKNDMLWFFHWVQSRRGGHYIFELKKRDE